MAAPVEVTVCMKWVPRRVVVDPLTGELDVDPLTFGPSPADLAALELALRLASSVTVVTAGPVGADAMLRDAVSLGARRVVRCDADETADSAAVAHALATVCRGADLVLCGDHSADRGSGSVPAFLAAELDASQALGTVSVELDAGGAAVVVERRLDRGRRGIVRAPFPAVVSVEGSAARIRRASLPAVIAARSAVVESGPVVRPSGLELAVGPPRPYRPRTKPRPAPTDGAPASVRILDITRATETREVSKLLHLDPADAAVATVDALRQWGYLD